MNKFRLASMLCLVLSVFSSVQAGELDPLVTPAQCEEAGLPSLTLSVSVPAGWSASATPGSGIWITMSSPPGGPRGFVVRRVIRSEKTDVSSTVIGDYQKSPTFRKGSSAQVDFKGQEWTAQTWIVGKELAQTTYFALWRPYKGSLMVVELYWWDQNVPRPSLASLPEDLRHTLESLAVED